METKKTDTFTKISGIFLILLASVMSAGIAVLNRSLKEVPYSVVLFYHSFFGLFSSTVLIVLLVCFTSRPLYFLDFSPFEDLLLFVATCLDSISVMSQTIAF